MGTLRRFPKSHIVAICLIATPLASLVVVNTSEERTQQTHNEMNLVSVPPIVGDALDRLSSDLQLQPVSPVRIQTNGARHVLNRIPMSPNASRRCGLGIVWRVYSSEWPFRKRDLAAVLESGPPAKVLQHIYPGHEIKFVTSPDTGLIKLSYAPDRLETLEFEREGDAFKAKHVTREAQISPAYKHATIDQSLFVASQQIGLTDEMTLRLAHIFQWDIDFVLDIRKGDEFSVLFEEKYVDGEFIGFGKILAAEFVNQNDKYRAVFYVDASGRGDYYSASGESLRKAFLRAPVEFSRISSNFNLRRLHPIQKRVMPHRGIDYVAPAGTPILAAGDARVSKATRTQPNGNFVILQHGDQIQTKYLHLSKFGRGIRGGTQVRQGQVIGYVGATGWATAPHLHYEFLVDGVHKDPRTVALPKARPIPSRERARFDAQTTPLLALLDEHRSELQIARNQ
jgi:murein DD-endopeptidase MepM/ murein hydrolase activator NlpD